MTNDTWAIVASAVARLDQTFGAEDVDQRRRLAEMRLLAIARPDHAAAAVDRACRRWARRPTLAELGELLRAERLGLVAEDDLTVPAEVGEHVAEIRALASRAVA